MSLRRYYRLLTPVLLGPALVLGTATPALAATPSLRIADLTVTETESQVIRTVTITRSAPTTTKVTVKVRSVAGTAVTPADFLAVPLTTVTFLPGQASRTVTVKVAGDALDEANETFTLLLSAPVGATIADGSGTVTIADNDATPTLSIAGQGIDEGTGGFLDRTVAVTLSAPSGRTVSAAWATSGGTAVSGDDFEPAAGSVSFPAGVTSRTVSVSLFGDEVDEPVSERFYVQLSAPVNANVPFAAFGRIFILDDDAPQSPILAAPNPSTGSSPTITLRGSATAGSLVQVYADGSCTGDTIAEVTAGELTSGIPVTAADNTTSAFSARIATAGGEVSECSTPVSYTHDDLAPNQPAPGAFIANGLLVFGPANDNAPELIGSADAGSTVRLYKDACLSSPVAKGTAARFASDGITFAVVDDTSSTMYVDALDAAGNRSVCTPAGTYTEDSTAPNPVFDGMSVVGSGGVGTRPTFTGTAEPGSAVEIHSFDVAVGACGPLVASVTAASLLSGVQLTVAAGTTTTFSTVVRDAAGNALECSSMGLMSYDEQSTEFEPNNDKNNASPGLVGATTTHGFGELSSSSDLDWYGVTVFTDGILTAETLEVPGGATCASNKLDTQIDIYDGMGFSVLNTDDDAGTGFCSLATVDGLTPGIYYVVVRRSPFANSLTYPLSYDLRMTYVTRTTVAESEVNDTAGTADAIGAFDPTTPRDATGVISPANEVDYFSFTMPGGKAVTLETVDGASHTCLSNLEDTTLTVYSSDGVTVVGSNTDSGAGLCSKLSLGVVGAGTYFVKVSAAAGTTPTYRLRLR